MTHDHTSEPWRVVGRSEIRAGVRIIADTDIYDRPDSCIEADAKRLVACVNACQGIPNPETTIPELISALRRIADHESRSDRRHRGMVDVSEVDDLQRTARQALARIEKGAPQG